jgi:aldose 1-epimerase
VGGTIARFDYLADSGKLSILRGSEGVPETALAAASFPLVPYCNRIRGGRFSFRGREIVIPRNLQQDASPLHGHGWQAPWTVEDVSGRDALLAFNHKRGDWPWDYEARQRFELDSEGLTLTLTCRNVDDLAHALRPRAAPLFSLHRLHDSRHGRHARLDDRRGRPAGREGARPGRYDLRRRRVCGQGLDNGFGGWGQTCRISDPAWPFAVSFSSSDAEFFQLYSPPEGDIFVAEPVTHANAAMNEPEERWSELGLRVLEPGEEMRLAVRFDIVPAG